MVMNFKKSIDNWEKYINNKNVPSSIRSIILESWDKCRKIGVDPYGGKGEIISQKELNMRLTAKEELISVAIPIMDSLYQIIKDTSYSIILTDQEGILLNIMQNENLKLNHECLNFVQGTRWDEISVGTNAIGTCLAVNQPIQVVGAEHFCSTHHGWTCSAAPIHDSSGKIIGCLDLSGRVEDVHIHTFGIVVSAVKSIEKQLNILEAYKLMDTVFESMSDGVMVIDTNYNLKRINNRVAAIFMVSTEELFALNIKEILKDIDIENRVFQQRKHLRYNDCDLFVNKYRVDCLLQITPIEIDHEVLGAVIIIREAKQVIKVVNQIAGFKANYTFEKIIANDKKMLETMAFAKKIARTNCTVLIEGESGTGKELFAQSIHNASRRSTGPFIAINCATLPRELVESELFGYEKGAFTGASKEGNPGKFELANGGTIFLDEIGEIPLEIQAKLLRVLDNHKVSRIGAKYERNLDVRVIAATNRDLLEEVSVKSFREDLYYRLNVISIKLIPLRERGNDILELAELFLQNLNLNNETFSNQKYLSDNFKQKIQRLEWKGNVRELQNVVQRAYYLCETDCIDSTYLPQIPDNRKMDLKVPYENKSFQQIQKESIVEALDKCKGNVTAAAKILNIGKSTIYRKINEYGINSRS